MGLPLGIAFARRGKKVVLYDINQDSVDRVNRKEMPFMDQDCPSNLAKAVDSGLLSATTEKSPLSHSDHIILVLGTPVDEHLNPTFRDVLEAVEEIAGYIERDPLIILRSTLYPGSTRKIHRFLLEKKGVASIAFCPERVAEGQALKEITLLPQIISACDPRSLKRAEDLFASLGVETVTTTPEEAELAKLFSNAWRYISFAISNQFFMIAENHGLDFYNIYDAMVHHYPRLQGFSRAGFTAGPCLLKDTLQLSAFSKNNFFLGHAAMLVNEGLPGFIIGQLKSEVPLAEMTVGILGMSFKANHDDPRDSLSYKLKKILELEAKKVVCSDAYFSGEGFLETQEAVRVSDVIIIGSPHRQYRDLDFQGKKVVDIWNFLPQP